jgi:Nif-specific regulatory protein
MNDLTLLLRESAWRPDFLTTLPRVIQETGPHIPVRQGLENILDTLVANLGYRRVQLELFDLPRKDAKISLDRGRDPVIAPLYGPGPVATGQVMATRRTLVIADVKAPPDFIGRPPRNCERLLSFLPIPAPREFRRRREGAPDQGGMLGTLSVDIPKPPPVFLEAHCDFLAVGAALVGSLSVRLRDELTRPRRRPAALPSEPVPSKEPGPAIPVAVSKSMRLVLRQVAQAATSNTPVLFRGEEGTGKEFLAAQLHAQSGRRQRPFLSLGCGSEPPEVAEETLFGVQKGEAWNPPAPNAGYYRGRQGGHPVSWRRIRGTAAQTR